MAAGQICTSAVLTQMSHPVPPHAGSIRAAMCYCDTLEKIIISCRALADGADSGQPPEKATKLTPKKINLTLNSLWSSELRLN